MDNEDDEVIIPDLTKESYRKLVEVLRNNIILDERFTDSNTTLREECYYHWNDENDF